MKTKCKSDKNSFMATKDKDELFKTKLWFYEWLLFSWWAFHCFLMAGCFFLFLKQEYIISFFVGIFCFFLLRFSLFYATATSEKNSLIGCLGMSSN